MESLPGILGILQRGSQNQQNRGRPGPVERASDPSSSEREPSWVSLKSRCAPSPRAQLALVHAGAVRSCCASSPRAAAVSHSGCVLTRLSHAPANNSAHNSDRAISGIRGLSKWVRRPRYVRCARWPVPPRRRRRCPHEPGKSSQQLPVLAPSDASRGCPPISAGGKREARHADRARAHPRGGKAAADTDDRPGRLWRDALLLRRNVRAAAACLARRASVRTRSAQSRQRTVSLLHPVCSNAAPVVNPAGARS